MRISAIFTLAVSFLVMSCVNNPTTEIEPPQNGKLVQNRDLMSQINSSSNTISINNVKYSVEPYAWRDFMPGGDPSARLNFSNTLIRADGEAIQDYIEIIQHYIVRNNEIWIPDDLDIRVNKSSPDKLHIVSRDGPTWEVGSKVNVSLKVKNQETDNIFIITALDVKIARTD